MNASRTTVPPLALLRTGLWLLVLVATATLHADDRTTVAPGGEHLAKFLDAMDVEHRWLSHSRVDWETGASTGPAVHNPAHATHCSAFAAAACERLGVPMLHPPEHPLKLLANAQYDWLTTQGTKDGWQPVDGAADAQALANQGQLVVAVFKNPDPVHPGHIAIVRPAQKTAAQLADEGPDITQAGGHNYRVTNVRQGFRFHPGAFKQKQIAYFAHPLASDEGS